MLALFQEISPFAHYLSLTDRFEALTTQAQDLDLIPESPAAVLVTIPGLSPLLVARYLAHLGHPQRFKQASQIWAFAGFDLVSEESGDFRRIGHITRKGQPGLRDTLFLIGLHTARNVPAIGRVKQKALVRGKGDVGATIHAAQKANRLCHLFVIVGGHPAPLLPLTYIRPEGWPACLNPS